MEDLAILAASVAVAKKTVEEISSKLFGPMASELGESWGVGAKLRTIKNQMRGLKKLEELCVKEGFKLNQVDLKVAFPYLQGIALEEDPELEDMWANLMANYLDSNKNLTTTAFPNVLKEMSTLDAKILEYGVKNSILIVVNHIINSAHEVGQFTESEIGNLERLGLVKQDFNTITDELSNRGAYMSNDSNPAALPPHKKWEYEVTRFGKDFYEACKR